MFVIWTVILYLCQIIVCKQVKWLRAEELSLTWLSTLEGSIHALSSKFLNKHTLNIMLCFYYNFWQPVIGFCMAWLPLHDGIIDGGFFHMTLLDIYLNGTNKQLMMMMLVAIIMIITTVIIILALILRFCFPSIFHLEIKFFSFTSFLVLLWLIWLLILITSAPNPICVSEMAQSYFVVPFRCPLLNCLGQRFLPELYGVKTT